MATQGGRASDQSFLIGTQRRIETTFYWMIVPFLVIAGRLFQLQAIHKAGEVTLPTGPDTIFTHTQNLPARRGPILAADGTTIAVSLDEYSVTANPRGISNADKETIIKALVGTIGGDENTYRNLLSKTVNSDGSKKYYVVLAKRVTADKIDNLRAIIQGDPKHENRDQRARRQQLWANVTLDPTPRRHYPLGAFASQLIGFTTDDGHGVDGLEAASQATLAGVPGKIVSQADALGRPLPGFVSTWLAPKPGNTVVTTIDPKIQENTDEVMSRLVQKYKPNFATAIVMRAATGEIVAMSTAPTFDLNKRDKTTGDIETNRCMTFAYEPGSTFKIITASAAVENVPGWQNKTFYCDGVQQVGKHLMHCWVNSTAQKRHGLETLSTSIRDSCNFGMYGFARLVGAPTMLEYAKKFGLGRRIHLDGMLDHPGVLPLNQPTQWSQEQLANFSFGQGMMLTPLQLVRIAATVANDGVMMKPMLIKEVRDENGDVVKVNQPTIDHRVIAADTAREVTTMMKRVTAEGTARKFVFVPGYLTAGKTGSAQKANGKKGYVEGKFISSFVGFLPADKPEYVILIMADEPHGSHWGSEVCGPAFADIATDAMLNLRLKEGTAAPQPVEALMTRPKPTPEKTS